MGLTDFAIPVHFPSRGTRLVAVALSTEGEVDAVALAEPETDPRYFGGERHAFHLDPDEQEVAAEWALDAAVELREALAGNVANPLQFLTTTFMRRAEVSNLERHPWK